MKVSPVLINGRASIEEVEGKKSIGVRFYMPDSRGSTELPDGSQGSHTTSYITIIRAILQCVDDNTIDSAIKDIKNFAEHTLGEDGWKKFDYIASPIPIILIEGDRRRKIREVVIKYSNDSDGQDVNLAIKHSKATQLVNYIADLTSCLLTELQREDLTTFYSKGRILTNKFAGDPEKGAAYALAMLNQLCKLCDMKDEDLEEEIPIFEQGLNVLSQADKDLGATVEDRIIRYGLNRFYPTNTKATDSGNKAKEIKRHLGDCNGLQEKREVLRRLRDDLLEKKDLIAQFQGDLLDYNRQLVFNLEEVKEDDLKKYFPTDLHKYDVTQILQGAKISNICTITRMEDSDLIKILSKHLHVMSVAFPDLHSNLELNNKISEIQKKFLKQEILTKQGWKDHEYENDNGDKVNIDAKYLKEKIDKHSNQHTTPTR